MTTKTTKERRALTLPERHTNEGPIQVRPLDTDLVPDAPDEDRREVVMLADSWQQRLNARGQLSKLENDGVRLPDKRVERTRGDRFLVDVQDLPRLLACEVVALPADLDAESDFNARAAELEAQRVERASDSAGELERHYQASRWQADADLVFAHPVLGGPLDRSKVRKRFKVAVKRAGCGRCDSTTSGTRSEPAWRGSACRCEPSKSGWGTRTLIYADYAPSEREREWVEVAFARAAESGEPQLSSR